MKIENTINVYESNYNLTQNNAVCNSSTTFDLIFNNTIIML